MNIRLEHIDMDQTIQCRASIDKETVDEYAQEMDNGTKFPAVILYGTKELAWIGDGWHRVLASEKIGAKTIEAELRAGGRIEALNYALGANANQGLRRTNKDKRKAVEIALREFSDLSSRQIAEKCGVGHQLVDYVRSQVDESATCPRKGADGKTYPAKRETRFPRDEREPEGNMGTEDAEREDTKQTRKNTQERIPPRNGMFLARLAVSRLGEIAEDDSERSEAFSFVVAWINERLQ